MNLDEVKTFRSLQEGLMGHQLQVVLPDQKEDIKKS